MRTRARDDSAIGRHICGTQRGRPKREIRSLRVARKRAQFLVKLLQTALLIEVKEQIRVCRDPKDDKFLELVASGNADCLVTSDADLLVIKSFRGTPILTPAEFLVWIAE